MQSTFGPLRNLMDFGRDVFVGTRWDPEGVGVDRVVLANQIEICRGLGEGRARVIPFRDM